MKYTPQPAMGQTGKEKDLLPFETANTSINKKYDDIAAEQKARSTYEYLIDMTDDPAVLAPLRFLREREIVHFQRFGEALEIARDHLNQQHYFFMQRNGCNTK